MSAIGAVVVHHANYPAVLRTVDGIVAQGIPSAQVIVIDNSEDANLADQLRQSLPSAAALEVVGNGGYGPAANLGARLLLAAHPTLKFILVSSHETRPAPGAVSALERALNADSELGVVGPTLISERQAPGPTVCWSQGGILTPLINEPRHIGYLSTLTAMPAASVVRRAWVDGAFCLYRAAILSEMAFRSDFFLYFEETELHTRMRKAGHSIGWVPDAVVEQSSAGIPPFLLGRNLQLFQQIHGTRLQRIFSVPTVIARRAARRLLRRGYRGEVGEIMHGWITALRSGA